MENIQVIRKNTIVFSYRNIKRMEKNQSFISNRKLVENDLNREQKSKLNKSDATNIVMIHNVISDHR